MPNAWHLEHNNERHIMFDHLQRHIADISTDEFASHSIPFNTHALLTTL